MMLTQARYAPPLDQDVSVIQGSPADLDDLERRLRPSCERSEPRQRAMVYLRGLLSPAERTHSGQLAALSGDATPDGVQHRLRRALWNPEAVLDELRHYLL
jgi:hypothetical protein